MRRLSFFLIMCFVVACGGGGSHHEEESNDIVESCSWLGMRPKIVNGVACNDSRSPIVRVIARDGNYDRFCSGVLIDASTVLTAGHCVPSSAQSVYVSYGKVSITQTRDAMQWFVYPKYNGKGPAGDVAVIKLRLNILNWPTVPVLLSRTAKADETGTIFGYGSTGGNSGVDVNTLRAGYAHVTQANASTILMKYSYDSNTCDGDSGGPLILMQNGVAAVAGITSSGTVAGCGYGDNSYFAALQDSGVQHFIKSHATVYARYM